jgi:FkbM family methyltransferase
MHTFLEPFDGDHISKTHALGRFYELDLLEAIRELKLGGTYVDVGAHIGNHSAFFARFCPSRKVIALEAQHGPVQEALFANVPADVEVVAPALVGSGRPRGRWADRPNAEGNSGMASWAASGREETRTLDSILRHRTTPGGVSLIKIDVEGLEPDVILGASETVNRERPVLVVEGVDNESIRRTLDNVCSGYEPTRGPLCATPTYIWGVV